MSEHQPDKSSETEAGGMTERPEAYHAVNGQPETPDAAAPMKSCGQGGSPMNESAEGGRAEGQSGGPRLVFRDGVAYVEGCDVPVWRLEMGRRAGSSDRATLGAFPSLTPEGLNLAYAYAREHSAEFDPLIQHHSGADVPPEDEGDEEDDAAFETELEALLERDAELLRRLAQ